MIPQTRGTRGVVARIVTQRNRKGLQACIGVRHQVYCEPVNGRPPLMAHPEGCGPDEAHDDIDRDPATIHVLLTVKGQPAACMRLAPDLRQARHIWNGGWPGELPEAERVAVLPEFRGNPAILYALLGCCVEESLRRGGTVWGATMRYDMVIALLKLGIPVETIADGRPVTYQDSGSVAVPLSGEPLYICLINIATDVLVSVWGWTALDAHTGTTQYAFRAMFPEHASRGWRPSVDDIARLNQLHEQIREVEKRIRGAHHAPPAPTPAG